jgi:hypothetical protein
MCRASGGARYGTARAGYDVLNVVRAGNHVGSVVDSVITEAVTACQWTALRVTRWGRAQWAVRICRQVGHHLQ